jgi:hypothetical protein
MALIRLESPCTATTSPSPSAFLSHVLLVTGGDKTIGFSHRENSFPGISS